MLPVLFCFYYLTQAVFVNHLWTFTGDFFDIVQSKRLIPLFTIGSSVGGFLGGTLGMAMSYFIGPTSLLFAWAVSARLRSGGDLQGANDARPVGAPRRRGSRRNLRRGHSGRDALPRLIAARPLALRIGDGHDALALRTAVPLLGNLRRSLR